MEITVLDNLLDIVFAQPPPQLIHVKPLRFQRLYIVETNSPDIFHDQNARRRQLVIHFRALDISGVGVQMPKLVDMACLDEKIHFLLGDRPHLIKNHTEINHITGVADHFQKSGGALQEDDILRHDVVNTRALDFDDNLVAARQDGSVNLCNGSGAQSVFID